MAITFPRAFPDGVAQQAFRIQRNDFVSPTMGGRVASVTAGQPLWTGTWSPSRTGRGRAALWRSWINSLRGSQKLFLGQDLSKPFPLAYPNGFSGLVRPSGAAFDGTATGWSVDGTRSIVTLGGLPVGLNLQVDDYIGWYWTTGGERRGALAALVEGALANGSGAATVQIEPALWSKVPASAVAYLAQPVALMRLVPNQTEFGAISRGVDLALTFTGIQDLLP